MLFRKDIEPNCLYCKWGCRVNEKELVCERRGLIGDPKGGCRRFFYDPLKRIPPRPQQLHAEGLTEEDFAL